MRERLASLISGEGTTMREVIKACSSNEVPMDIVCVISSNPLAEGVGKARKLAIPDKDIVVINPNDFRDGNKKINQENFGKAILKELRKRRVTVVTQNGWLPLTPKNVIKEYENKIFNQHPGPVPEFGGKGMYGRRVHTAVLLFTRMTNREPWTEAVVQRVHRENDQGAVVKSARIEIKTDDTVESLSQRVLLVEHRIQIELLKDVAAGKVGEITRRKKLVRPGQEEALDLAKKVGILLYPRG